MPLHAALASLLTGLFDWAGLFPPAALPLDQAVNQYAAQLQHPLRALQARFIVPMARLDEFVEKRRKIAREYTRLLGRLPFVAAHLLREFADGA